MNPSLKDIKPLPEHDTVDYLAKELEKSDRKLVELRNLLDDLRSKLIVENSFNRYIRDRFKRKIADMTNIKLPK